MGLLREFCAAKGLPYEECGKLVVALDGDEERRLKGIFERATANGVPGVEMLGPEGIREVEPNAVGVAALRSPGTAIVDYAAVTRALADDVVAAGGRVLLGREVRRVREEPTGVVVETDGGRPAQHASGDSSEARSLSRKRATSSGMKAKSCSSQSAGVRGGGASLTLTPAPSLPHRRC